MRETVVVAGHACLDITPAFADATPRPLGQVLQPGKLVQMHGVTVSAGGCVSNTGLALRRLGTPVRLAARVGQDAFGRMLRGLYAEAGAACILGTDEVQSTSYSVVVAAPGVDRIFLHDPGANDTFSADDLPPDALRDAALFHFGYPPLMRHMYAQGGAALHALLGRVRRAGVASSLDMALVAPDTPAARADWPAILAGALPLTDCFVPSAEELCLLLDAPRHAAWLAAAAGRDVTDTLRLPQDVLPLARRALALGAGIVLIKCGARGMLLCTAAAKVLRGTAGRLGRDAAAFCASWADKVLFQPAYRPARVLSGTGAGDTCIAAFLKALLEGCPPQECLQLAAATGACCVESYDAVSGLAGFDELRARIAAGWPCND